MAICATAIDSGGHHTDEVYQFTRLRRWRNIIAVKGASRSGRPVLAQRPSKVDVTWRGTTHKQGAELWFIGTDTAPHLRSAKQAECCSAGVFGGATALQTYVQVFDEEGALPHFEAFAAENGARFYGLPLNEGTITLEKRPCRVSPTVAVGEEDVVIFRGGEELPWSLGEVWG